MKMGALMKRASLDNGVENADLAVDGELLCAWCIGKDSQCPYSYSVPNSDGSAFG